jgi:membrane-bound metal-dependent hydrolase YbcI (DUF457 family)
MYLIQEYYLGHTFVYNSHNEYLHSIFVLFEFLFLILVFLTYMKYKRYVHLNDNNIKNKNED